MGHSELSKLLFRQGGVSAGNFGVYSKLIKIIDHQLEFQSFEFLWVILSRIMASNDHLGDFLAAYAGYQNNQSSSWAFFLDYYDSCKMSNTRIPRQLNRKPIKNTLSI